MKSWLLPLAVFVVAWLFLAPYLGLSGFWPSALFSAAVVVILGHFGILLPKIQKIRGISAIWIGVGLLLIAGLMSGWFASYGFSMPGALPTGQVVTGPASVVVPTTTTTTTTGDCVVSDELYGKTATLVLNCYDQESNTPWSAAVDQESLHIYNNGAFLTSATDCSAGSVTAGVAVGDVITIYGENQSDYYIDKKADICIDKQQYPIEIDVHAMIDDEANMSITCYDDTGATSCSGATNTSEEDADITLGQDSEESFYLKIKTNVANKAFRLGGIATLARNDIDDCYPVSGQGLTKVAVPDFLSGTISLCLNSTETQHYCNVTGGYDKVYKLDTPELLSEWESKKYQFTIEASSSADPATTTGTSSDICGVYFVDSAFERGDDGMVDDIYVHDAGEGNAGFDENEFAILNNGSSQYQGLGYVIEGI